MSEFPIATDLDVFGACRGALEIAAKAGFPHIECEQIAIVVSELATNILKYGIRGSIAIEKITDPSHGPGVRIAATDQGPPFHNLEMALQDGFDDRGKLDPAALHKRRGLGRGLGAVVRLTHFFECEVLKTGKQVRVIRYVRPLAAKGTARG